MYERDTELTRTNIFQVPETGTNIREPYPSKPARQFSQFDSRRLACLADVDQHAL